LRQRSVTLEWNPRPFIAPFPGLIAGFSSNRDDVANCVVEICYDAGWQTPAASGHDENLRNRSHGMAGR
jgi:hypothetical protein